MKKSLPGFVPIIFTILSLNACSKNKSPDLDGIKSAKFTIQVSGLEQNDYANFIFSSGAAGNSTVWKINGTERSNESVVSLDEDDLKGGAVFVIETSKPVTAISAGYQFTNGDNTAHSPIAFSYKAEINGTVVKEIKSQAIAAADQLKTNYSYP